MQRNVRTSHKLPPPPVRFVRAPYDELTDIPLTAQELFPSGYDTINLGKDGSDIYLR